MTKNQRKTTKVTIVIPTYNRPNYLNRILDYYNSRKNDCCYDIIIADSSSYKNKTLNKKIVSCFPDLDILYLSDYSDDINYYHKFADAINQVKTKYSLICGDDDFVIPNSIKRTINFLENNKNYTAAHGYYITFCIKTNQLKEKQLCWNRGYHCPSIDAPDNEFRFSKHLANYTHATLYAVHKTAFLKIIFQETREYTNDDQFGELLPSLLTVIYGKIKRLNSLYAVREITPNSAGKTSKTMYDFIKDGSYQKKYSKFKTCLTKHLQKNTQLSITESKKIIDDAMSLYIKKYYSFYLKHYLCKISDILKILPTPISVLIKSALLFLHNKYTFLIKKSYKANFLDHFSPKDNDDFNKICHCIMAQLK